MTEASGSPIAIAGLNAAVTASSQAKPALADLQGHWAQPFVATLANSGIIQGFPDGTFLPDAPITQEQFTAMVQHAFPDEAIDPNQIPLKPGMTRAEAARVIYQALADQGKVAPIASLVSTPTQPFNGSAPAASNNAAAPERIAVLESNSASNSASNSRPSATPQAEAKPEVLVGWAPLNLATPEVAQPEQMRLQVMDLAELTAANLPSSPTSAATTSSQPSNSSSDVAMAKPPLASRSAQHQDARGRETNDRQAQNREVQNRTSQGQETQPQNTRTPAAVTVAIMGEVSQPGGYRLMPDGTSTPTLIQAIQTAGGVTPSADIRQVQVRRGSADNQIVTVDLWKMLQTGNLRQGEMQLQSGDTILIPKATRSTAEAESSAAPSNASTSASISGDRIQVSVVGEVNHPGRLELPMNISASQAILASGGLNGQAHKAELIRLNPNGAVVRRVIAVDGSSSSTEGTNPALQDEDVILVYRTVAATTASSAEASLSSLLSILPNTADLQ